MLKVMKKSILRTYLLSLVITVSIWPGSAFAQRTQHVFSSSAVASSACSGLNNDLSNGYTLAFFTADWCRPCKEQAPAFNKVAADDHYKQVSFPVVEDDDEAECTTSWGVSSLPTMILLKDGQEVKRLIGYQNAVQLKTFLNNNLND